MKKQKLHCSQFLFCLAICTLLINCGNKTDDNSLLVPRGSTISVRTLASISTETHRKGDVFSAILVAPAKSRYNHLCSHGIPSGWRSRGNKKRGGPGRSRAYISSFN